MAVDNVLDLLEEKYKKKKTERRIFLITNGQGLSDYQKSHMNFLAKRA